MAGFAVEFGKFLIYLLPRPCGIRPIKAYTCSSTLQFCRPLERREPQRYSGEGALVLLLLTLSGFDLFPSWAELGVAEDVGVPSLQFIAYPVNHLIEVEVTGFFGYLRVEDYLELEIAEFVLQPVHVVASYRIS